MNANQHATIAHEIEKLGDLTVNQLREKWVEVWNEPCRSRNKDYLRKRIAWRIQARAFGGLSERALRRSEELADETLLRILPPRKAPSPPSGKESVSGKFVPADGESRLPMPGTQLTRDFQGRKIIVKVREHGFEYEGEIYKSLSAVAKAATGTHWNGYVFFGLTKGKEAA
jgi:hypothetical protein